MGGLAFIQENIETISSIIVVGVVILGIIGAVGYPIFRWFLKRAERTRSAAMKRWADEMGMRFSSKKIIGDNSVLFYPRFNCFRKGTNRFAYNVVGGRPSKVMFLDFHYEVSSTEENFHYLHDDFSVVIVESACPLLPLSIQPESALDRAVAAFGWEDINFESAEFSRRFRVQGFDRRWVYDVIHGKVMEMLLGMTGISVECDRRSMICYGNNRRFNKKEFAAALGLVQEILGQMPKHATERARARG